VSVAEREPFKREHIMQYTEVVYYDATGAEVAREELHDAHTYDVSRPIAVTADELEDYYG
jgi:Zn-dependent membrane protease YugP